jgi:hypothetical protein
MVKVNEVLPFTAIVCAPNAFAIDGGETTATDADATEPAIVLLPRYIAETLPVVLFMIPAAVPVTLTESEQLTPAGRLMAETPIEEAPGLEAAMSR